jgi:hypothetical protein
MAEKARTLYKKTDAAGLAVLIFEAMLLGSTESISHNKDDDSLTIAAALHKIDTKALRASVVKEEREKVEKKAKKVAGKLKSQPVSKRAASNKTDTRSGGCPEKASPRSVNIPTRAGFVQVDLPENGPQPAMHPTMN